ncbi:MAG TPA: ABC transporter permease [Thermoplasmata archaeon]|nr:ABC transporter permease [Thermoplasmata archaeon]
MQSFRKSWTVFATTIRYLLGTRRVIPMAFLATVPFLVTVGLAAGRVATFDINLFQLLMVPLFLQIVVIFITLVNATTLIREEIDDNTLPYLLTRPISKPAIATSKYLAYVVTVLVLLIPPVVLAYAVTEAYSGTGFGTDSDVLAGFLVATILASIAYGALFLFVSVLLRKPLAVGLLIGFVWESIVGAIPGDVPKLSIIHYLRSILRDMIAVGPYVGYRPYVSAGVAAAVLIVFTIAMLVLTILVFQQMEFRQKA